MQVYRTKLGKIGHNSLQWNRDLILGLNNAATGLLGCYMGKVAERGSRPTPLTASTPPQRAIHLSGPLR